MAADCLICAKHRGEGPLVGPLIWADDQVVVFHKPFADDRTDLGYLFVETRRHTPALDSLTRSEAAAAADAAWHAAKALRAELAPDYVFSAIVGTGVPHFHQHLFARPAGIPSSYAWTETTWPDAPTYGTEELTDLCSRLTTHFPDS